MTLWQASVLRVPALHISQDLGLSPYSDAKRKYCHPYAELSPHSLQHVPGKYGRNISAAGCWGKGTDESEILRAKNEIAESWRLVRDNIDTCIQMQTGHHGSLNQNRMGTFAELAAKLVRPWTCIHLLAKFQVKRIAQLSRSSICTGPEARHTKINMIIQYCRTGLWSCNCENGTTSLGDQGVVFQIDSLQHSFSPRSLSSYTSLLYFIILCIYHIDFSESLRLWAY
jgi:hypothetical protein